MAAAATPQEQRSVQASLLRNSVCASAAAATATGLFNPLDTLRVRWQLSPVVAAPAAQGGAAAAASVAPPAGTSLLRFAGTILATEGFFAGLWRPGALATMLSMGTSCGIRMGCYPYLRDWLAGDSQKTPALMFGTGLFAGGMGYWASCPFFQAKTRLQAATILQGKAGNPGGHGVFTEMYSVWLEGSFPALFRGASPLVVRGALFSAGQTLGYDGTKTLLSQRNQIMEDGPALHVIGSVVAAFFATVLSAPADYVMTRYQVAAQVGAPYAGPVDCAVQIAKKEGPAAFYRGWTPYFARIVPVFLTFHPLFEQLRKLSGMSYMT